MKNLIEIQIENNRRKREKLVQEESYLKEYIKLLDSEYSTPADLALKEKMKVDLEIVQKNLGRHLN